MCYDRVDRPVRRQKLRMFKAFLMSLLLVVIFMFADFTDLFAILSHKVTQYIACGLLLTVCITAVIVLKPNADKGTEDEKDNK